MVYRVHLMFTNSLDKWCFLQRKRTLKEGGGGGGVYLESYTQEDQRLLMGTKGLLISSLRLRRKDRDGVQMESFEFVLVFTYL